MGFFMCFFVLNLQIWGFTLTADLSVSQPLFKSQPALRKNVRTRQGKSEVEIRSGHPAETGQLNCVPPPTRMSKA